MATWAEDCQRANMTEWTYEPGSYVTGSELREVDGSTVQVYMESGFGLSGCIVSYDMPMRLLSFLDACPAELMDEVAEEPSTRSGGRTSVEDPVPPELLSAHPWLKQVADAEKSEHSHHSSGMHSGSSVDDARLASSSLAPQNDEACYDDLFELLESKRSEEVAEVLDLALFKMSLEGDSRLVSNPRRGLQYMVFASVLKRTLRWISSAGQWVFSSQAGSSAQSKGRVAQGS